MTLLFLDQSNFEVEYAKVIRIVENSIDFDMIYNDIGMSNSKMHNEVLKYRSNINGQYL